MEIDVRGGTSTSVENIRFHDNAVVGKSGTTYQIKNNTGAVLVPIPASALDDLINALQLAKKVFP